MEKYVRLFHHIYHIVSDDKIGEAKKYILGYLQYIKKRKKTKFRTKQNKTNVKVENVNASNA